MPPVPLWPKVPVPPAATARADVAATAFNEKEESGGVLAAAHVVPSADAEVITVPASPTATTFEPCTAMPCRMALGAGEVCTVQVTPSGEVWISVL